MTFSSGMPCTYLIPIIGFLILFWVDKWLVLRYYRRVNNFTHHLTNSVAMLLPKAALIHIFFGLMMFSYRYFLKSTYEFDEEDNTLTQNHMICYIITILVVYFVVMFETTVISAMKKMYRCMKCCKESKYCCAAVRNKDWFPDPIPKKHNRNELYEKLSYIQLYRDYKTASRDRKKIEAILIDGNEYDKNEEAVSGHVDILKRNEYDIYKQLLVYVERLAHLFTDPYFKNELLKIEAVAGYFEHAFNKDNDYTTKLLNPNAN
jgi:hypothetical protein